MIGWRCMREALAISILAREPSAYLIRITRVLIFLSPAVTVAK